MWPSTAVDAYVLVCYAVLALIVVLAVARRSFRLALVGGILGLVQVQCAASVFVARGFPIAGFYGHAYLQLCVLVQSLSLARPRLRPLPYRLIVSIPAAFYNALSLMTFALQPLLRLVPQPYDLAIPIAIALLGMYNSLRATPEDRVIVLDEQRPARLRRVTGARIDLEVAAPAQSAAAAAFFPRPLTIFQITDCHLGPFQSAKRLRETCERAVAKKPDLIVLTGDYYTMEAHGSPGALFHALEPLTKLRERTVACLGNHDYEALELVKNEFAALKIPLLIDEELIIDVPDFGSVQCIGHEFYWPRGKPRERLLRVLRQFPRRPGMFRLDLLHNPNHFRWIPEGDADLVLSGHHHGGQVGCLSCRLPCTILSLSHCLPRAMPDHGLWGLGSNRCYAHRGTGHYGFPLRLGVPSEESILHVHWKRSWVPAADSAAAAAAAADDAASAQPLRA